jgi:hypothetical protein
MTFRAINDIQNRQMHYEVKLNLIYGTCSMFSVIARKNVNRCRQITTSKVDNLLFFKRFQNEIKYCTLNVVWMQSSRCYHKSILHNKSKTTNDYKYRRSTDKFTNVQQPKNNKQKFSTNKDPSIIKLGKKIANASNCNEILYLIEHSLDKYAGGGRLDHVSFSTSVNRLARHLSKNKSEQSIVIRDDKRFSLLFASLAEALVSEYNKLNDDSSIHFDSQALANIGWAIAKLSITIPVSQLPILQSYELQNENDNGGLSSVVGSLLSSAGNLRSKFSDNNTTQFDPIQTSSRNKQSNQKIESELTVLASQILDFIGIVVSRKINAVIAREVTIVDDMMNLQECANLLWAWATAGRADPKVFESVSLLMIDQVHELLETGSIERLQPQNMSNTLWAVSFHKFVFKTVIFIFCFV